MANIFSAFFFAVLCIFILPNTEFVFKRFIQIYSSNSKIDIFIKLYYIVTKMSNSKVKVYEKYQENSKNA